MSDKSFFKTILLILLPSFVLASFNLSLLLQNSYPAERWTWRYIMNSLCIQESRGLPAYMPDFGGLFKVEYITYFSMLILSMISSVTKIDIIKLYSFFGGILQLALVPLIFIFFREFLRPFFGDQKSAYVSGISVFLLNLFPYYVFRFMSTSFEPISWVPMFTALSIFLMMMNKRRSGERISKKFYVLCVVTLGSILPTDTLGFIGATIFIIAYILSDVLTSEANKNTARARLKKAIKRDVPPLIIFLIGFGLGLFLLSVGYIKTGPHPYATQIFYFQQTSRESIYEHIYFYYFYADNPDNPWWEMNPLSYISYLNADFANPLGGYRWFNVYIILGFAVAGIVALTLCNLRSIIVTCGLALTAYFGFIFLPTIQKVMGFNLIVLHKSFLAIRLSPYPIFIISLLGG